MSYQDKFSKISRKRSRSKSPAKDSNEARCGVEFGARLTGLLPAISQWFRSKTTRGNGSTPTDEVTDSSDDEPEVIAPKRFRRNSPDAPPSLSLQTEDTSSQTVNLEPPKNPDVIYNSIQSVNKNYYIQKDQHRSTQSASISQVEGSNPEATSENVDATDRDITYKPSPKVSTVCRSTKRQSISDTAPIPENEKPKSTQSSMSFFEGRPRFKSALYGSPFYGAQTMYGGAYGFRNYENKKKCLNNSKCNKIVKVTKSHKSPQSEFSSSSKKIMEIMENFSSPLTEAKRISNSLRQNLQLDSKSRSSSTSAMPITPSIASVLSLQQRSRLRDSTNAARQIMASQSSTSRNPNESEGKEKDAKKDTYKLTSHSMRAQRGEDPLAMPEPVQLPTAVLRIDKNNLPKFTITAPGEHSSTSLDSVLNSSCKPQEMSDKDANTLTMKMPPMTSDSTTFPFPNTNNSPVIRNSNNNCFSFENNRQITTEPKAREETVQYDVNQNSSTAGPSLMSTPASSRGRMCSDYSNVSKPNSKDSAPALPAPALIPNNLEVDWKCESCLNINKCTVKKCAACGGSKPGAQEPAASASTAVITQAERDWRCDICLIMNESSQITCAACRGSRSNGTVAAQPAPQPISLVPVNKSPDAKIQQILEAQKKKWECRSCLSRNDPDVSKCQCCDTEREGTSKEITPQPFMFPKESNTTFKFGIDPKEQEKNIIEKSEQQANLQSLTIPAPAINNNTFTVLSPLADIAESDNSRNNVDNSDYEVSVVPDTDFMFQIPKKTKDQQPAGTIMEVNVTTNSSQEISFNEGLLQPQNSGVDQAIVPKRYPTFLASSPMVSTEPNQSTIIAMVNQNINDKTFSMPNRTGVDARPSPFSSTLNVPTTAFPFATSVQNEPATTAGTNFLVPSSQPAADVFSGSEPVAGPSTAPQFGIASNATPVTLSFGNDKAPPFGAGLKTGTNTGGFSIRAPNSSAGNNNSGMSSLMSGDDEPRSGELGFRPQLPAASVQASFPFCSGNQVTTSNAGSGSKAPVFGAPSQSMFKSGSLFGSASQAVQQPPPIFGAQPTQTPFGAQSQPTGFGTSGPAQQNLFGEPTSTQQSAFNRSSQQSAFGVPSQSQAPAFGAPSQNQPSAFGAPTQSQPPAFGGPTQCQSLVFGAPTQSQPPAFGGPIQSQSLAFGGPTQTQPPAFGGPTQSQPPAFGGPTQSQPPAFGGPPQSQPPVFGGPSQSQQSAFGGPPQSQPSAFGGPPQSQLPAFGGPSQSQPSAFGGSSQSQPPAFGGSTQSQPPLFGGATQSQLPPAFGTSTQSQPPAFGPSTQSQPPAFGPSTQSQPLAFGPSTQSHAFGTQSQNPAFGASEPNVPTAFGAPSVNPIAPAQGFQFGSGVFSFGQQAQVPLQSNVYSFGSGNSINNDVGIERSLGHLGSGAQFAMGSAPSAASNARRVRKAVRRVPPR